MEILPDYLAEEIIFQRPQAAKFYARVDKALTQKFDVDWAPLEWLGHSYNIIGGGFWQLVDNGLVEHSRRELGVEEFLVRLVEHGVLGPMS